MKSVCVVTVYTICKNYELYVYATVVLGYYENGKTYPETSYISHNIRPRHYPKELRQFHRGESLKSQNESTFPIQCY